MAKAQWDNQHTRGRIIADILANMTSSLPDSKLPQVKKASGMAGVALNRFITNASPEVLETLTPDALFKQVGEAHEFKAFKHAILNLSRTK